MALFGSRTWTDTEKIGEFLDKLHANDPGATVISGGALGADTSCERGWYDRGGAVYSLRPMELSPERFIVQAVTFGVPNPAVHLLGHPHPTFADYASCCTYRDMLIAEACDWGACFWDGRSRGTAFTREWARIVGKAIQTYHVGPPPA